MTHVPERPFPKSGTDLNPQLNGIPLKRKRAPRTPRPIDPDVQAALAPALNRFAGHWTHADHDRLGLFSPEMARDCGFDLQAYETLNITHGYKYASFFTTVKRVNDIILEYAAQGLLPLTLRQIHYQMVTRHEDYSNTNVSYAHLCEDLAVARMCGFVPWNAIDDPTRDLHDFRSWRSPEERIVSAAETYHLNRWENQLYRPLVLVEKDAALGTITRVCEDLDVPYLSCKGYGSLSCLRGPVTQHCLKANETDRIPVVIHLSDHDPTGSDMERNLRRRLDLFVGQEVDVRHIALTPQQILDNDLLPQPVKETDPRTAKYLEKLKEHELPEASWEMDALSPTYLRDLIRSEIDSCRNQEDWNEVDEVEKQHRRQIEQVAGRWTEVRAILQESDGPQNN